jgi:hypothetical protein
VTETTESERVTAARVRVDNAREKLEKIDPRSLAILSEYIQARNELETIERQELHLSRINTK